ncbi:protein FAR1-RELATED SEQUENCE 5 [Sesamum angolense]|uniref:Protein FAR1-RELATED SEQUENCE 5 n=1 Tax=Sesamum angolense TaxID=2727404 RepID=A0AAE1WGF3_9LAMI|nr:protein FAR1-RELATED SEQUENCE 5 [Sesamum angolense]
MDPGAGVGVSSAFEDGIREKDGPTPRVDANVEQTSEAPNFSCDDEVAFVHVDASLSQEASSADKDGMDIDSESTYSCLNGSSDENSVDSDGEDGYTSQNGSSIDHHSLNKDTENGCRSPKAFSGSGNNGPNIVGKQNDQSPGLSSDNQLGMDTDDKHMSQTSEAPSSASSGSGQAIKDEAGEYVVPKLGVEFESEDHAYKCYNRYALMEGFSIRKDFVNRSKVTGLVVSRRYTCHRQGYGSIKRDVNVNKPRKETRTGCLAHMTITRQTNGKYRVIHFETRHNHEFVTPFTAHLLPSQKRISFVEAVEAESAVTPVPDGVPKLGMGFESEDHAYEFYNAYAGRIGFSVRKDYVNRSKIDGAVASRRYTCFREGYRQKDKRGLKVKRPRKETRVGCMAQLVISRQADGRYRVTHFEERHNHELVPACKVRMLRSQKRSVTDQIVESTASGGSNVQPKSLAELLLTGVGIQDFIYDPIDHETRLTSKREWNIKPDEPESIHQYFHSKKLKDPSFFYAVQCDVDDEMTNFFWADEKMLVDFGDFGDVVCFDSTSRINKDWRPLVLFFGINNHRQILVFGAAFLYDDSAQSFKWLFRTFKRAMSGKTPKTIVSDKDAVISEAIISELPETHHRLCTWQIYQSALKHLNQVVVNSDSFSSDLCGCIFNPDEEDFVNSWKVLLDTYGLWGNEWLHGIFEEREKWALPYRKHIFSADIDTALLSEDSITSLKKYLKPESHVLQFIKHIGKVVNDWRYKELEANYDMGQHMPRLMGDVIMLKQVREVYTPVIFKTFHQEYENCLNIVINQCIDTVSSVEYKVSTYGQVCQYTVLYSSEDDSVACSCLKFHNNSAANRMGDSACLMHGFTYASALPNDSTLGNPMHGLGDSISFGRFMTESLSWEKWSTFSHKKYVEEAERYAQPGSVAQKKAFFEAHYKRIAARKAAALLEQENAAKITEAEGVGDNNAYDEKRVILNSHQDVDVKIEVVKIQEDTKKDSIVDVIEHGLIAAIGIDKEGERADTVSALGSSGPPKLERPSLKQNSVASADIPSLSSNEKSGLSLLKTSIQDKPWKIPSTPAKPVTPHPKENESNVPQSTTKLSVEKKGASPNSLLSLMNLVPIEAAYPTTTPLSESRRRKTTTDPSVPGSKTAGPKWHVLSAVLSKKITVVNFIHSCYSENRRKTGKRKPGKAALKPTNDFKGPIVLLAKTGKKFTKLSCGFCFRTRPLPDFNKETEAPETRMEKTPAAQPESAVLGRSGLDKRQGTISMPPPPPPPTCLAKNSASKNLSRKKVHNPSKFLVNSLPDGITHENASPNIQQ